MEVEIGSDYSGIGAFDYATKRVFTQKNIKNVFACDVDKFARVSYVHNHGTQKDIQILSRKDYKFVANIYHKIFVDTKSKQPSEEDIELAKTMAKTIAEEYSFKYYWNVYEREIPQKSLGIYMTSPPCQGFSIAGKRGGSILFYNSHEFIQVNKPRFFIFENVEGLLSHGKNKNNKLQKIGSTFNNWLMLLGGKSVNGQPTIFPDKDSVPYHIYWRVLNTKEHNVPQNRDRVFIVGIRDDVDNDFSWPQKEPLKLTLHDCLETFKKSNFKTQEEFDKYIGKYFLSESYKSYLLKRSDNFNDGKINLKNDYDIASCLTASAGKLDISDNIIKVGTLRTHKDGHGFREVKDGNCPTIPARAREDGSGQAVICIPVQSPDRTNKKQNGKGYKKDGEVSFTLTATDQHGIFDGYEVRRLTPRESLNLQDFPIKHKIVVADAQIYRQTGNSITVRVLEKIIEKNLKCKFTPKFT